MDAAVIIFWSAVGLAVYTYFGYPLLLFMATMGVQAWRDFRFLFRRRDRRVESRTESELPVVSVIVPAYNEAGAIRSKIENCLALDYPREKLEVIIASDGSDDGTNEVAEGYADRGIVLAGYRERRGKPSVINETAGRARGEILVLTDATTMIDRGALRLIVRHFEDPRVGAVNGELRFSSPGAGHKGEGLYWRYEVMLKFLENRLGVVLGSSGALCAVRKTMYRAIPANCICDDLLITLNVVKARGRAVYDPEARSTEETAASVKQEAARRVRIGAGNFQTLGMTLGLLSPLRGAIAWCYVSHKVFKWVTWVFLAAALASNVLLLERSLYQVTFAVQAGFYAAAGLGALGVRVPVVGRVFGVVYYFVSMHVALLRGFVRWVSGRQAVMWKRSYR